MNMFLKILIFLVFFTINTFSYALPTDTNKLFVDSKEKLNQKVSTNISDNEVISKVEKSLRNIKSSAELNDNLKITEIKVEEKSKKDIKLSDNDKNLVDLKKEEKYFELVSPNINVLGEVVLDNNLLISLKVLKKIDANLSINKVKSENLKFFLNSNRKNLNNIILQAPILNVREGKDVDPIYEIKLDLNSISENELDKLYMFLVTELIKASEIYETEYIKTLKQNTSISREILNSIIFDRVLLKNNMHNLYYARNKYELLTNLYYEVKSKYDNMYSEKVVDNLPIVIDGALPYFNINLNDVSVGKYELIITSAVDNTVLEKINFYVTNDNKVITNFYNKIQKQIMDILNN